jgi:hypothetical protein
MAKQQTVIPNRLEFTSPDPNQALKAHAVSKCICKFFWNRKAPDDTR